MSICDDLPNLNIFDLSTAEADALGFVVGDSGKQGIITFENLKGLLDVDTVPAGFTVDWYGDANTIPNGWLLLDGSLFDQTTYPKLFRLLGSEQLPDYRGRVTEGGVVDPNNVGSTQGVNTVVLTTDNMAAHSHAYTDTTGLNNPSSQGDNSSGKYEGDDRFKPSSTPLQTTKETEPTGGGQPIDNIQPTVLVNKLIKT